MSSECPVCGEEYDERVSLCKRRHHEIDVSDVSKLCQDYEQRSRGRAMKKTRADTEKYKFVGYLHK